MTSTLPDTNVSPLKEAITKGNDHVPTFETALGRLHLGACREKPSVFVRRSSKCILLKGTVESNLHYPLVNHCLTHIYP